MVEVHEQHGNLTAVAMRAVDRPVDAILEYRTIVQTSEDVVTGKIADALFGLFAAPA